MPLSSRSWSWKNLSLSTRGLLVVLLPLLGAIVAAVFGVYFSVQNIKAREWAIHSIDVRTEVTTTRSLVRSVWVAHVEYLLSRNYEDFTTEDRANKNPRESLARVSELVSDNADQLRRAEVVKRVIEELDQEIQRQRDSDGSAEAPKLDVSEFLHARSLAFSAIGTLDEMLAAEQLLTNQRLAEQANSRRGSLLMLGLALGIAVVATLALGVFHTRGIIRRLAELGELAAHWASGDVPNGKAIVPKDEIGRLHTLLLNAAQLTQLRARELDESRRDFQAVMDNMTSILFIKTPEGKYHFINRAYENFLGATLEEIRGQSHTPRLLPESADPLSELDAVVFDAKGPTTTEDHVVVPTGDYYFLTTRFALPDADGNARLMCGIATDITARKRVQDELEKYRLDLEDRVVSRTKELTLETEAHLASNRRLRSQVLRMQLLNQLTKLIAGRHDLRSLFQTVLSYLREEMPISCGIIFHFEKDSDILVVGASLDDGSGILDRLELLPGHTARIGMNGIRRSLSGETIHVVAGAPHGEGVLAELAQEGIQSMVVAPLRASDATHGIMVVGRPTGGGFESSEAEFLTQLGEHIAIAVAQLRLLNDLQRSNRDLKDAHEHMAQQERLRAMGQMASGIAHDINNALGPVTVYADILLEDQKLDPESQSYIRTILTAAEGIAETVSRLRHFYRPAEELATLSNLNVNAIIQEVVSLTRPRWRDLPQSKGHTITLELSLASNLPSVPGWDGDMRSVITNLIFNSVDAIAEDGRINITSSNRGEFVAIEVSDTGAGMDEQTRLHCLEPFYTTKGEKGTGLGLPMVYGIVARHEGRIEIESTPGLGTTVRLLLPTKARGVQEAIVASVTNRRVMNLRLLCVDDDPTIRESLRTMLTRDGHTTKTADSGPAALEMCAQEEAAGKMFDLIVTDLGMPRMDGRELAVELAKLYPQVPVILLTGWGSQLIEHRGSITGFVDILAKPPRIAELRVAISKAMDGESN
jgi:PAS domain S-box-containing protein